MLNICSKKAKYLKLKLKNDLSIVIINPVRIPPLTKCPELKKLKTVQSDVTFLINCDKNSTRFALKMTD